MITRRFIAILITGAALRVPSFFTPLLSDDEAIYATTADAMQRGDALYRDVVDHKPPAIYDIYRAAFAIFGQYQTHGAHLFVLLAVLATAWALRFAARAIRGDARDGDWAALLWVVFSTTWHDYDALAANCELFLVLPQAMAFAVLVGRGAKRKDAETPSKEGTSFASLRLCAFALNPNAGIGRYAMAGFLVGLSTTLKYQGFTFLGVIALALVLDVVARRLTIWRALGYYIVAKTASVVPLGLYALSYTIAGNLDAAVYWFVFNFTYISAGFTGLTAALRFLMRLGMIGGVAIAAYAFGFLGASRAIRNGISEIRARKLSDTTRAQLLAAAWIITSAIALIPGGRYFGHYFHLILPAICVLATAPLLAFWDHSRQRRAIAATLIAAPAVVFFLLATFLRPWIQTYDDPTPPYETVAARVQALTRLDDRIFVWGNSPQMYVLARRPMGSRFSFCNYMTGEASSDKSASATPDEKGGVRPPCPSGSPFPPRRRATGASADCGGNKGRGLEDAWRMLFDDLDRRKPRLFLDAAAAGWDGYAAFPIANYPRLAAYVANNYRLIEHVAGVAVHERRNWGRPGRSRSPSKSGGDPDSLAGCAKLCSREPNCISLRAVSRFLFLPRGGETACPCHRT